MKFGQSDWLALLWLVPLLGLVVVLAERGRVRALDRLVSGSVREKMVWPFSTRFRRFVRKAMVVAAVGFVVVGLARPEWNPEEKAVKSTGRDIVFLIDVSRSMLAQDLAPNRLDRTKIWIGDLVASLAGDRVGIVAFAGGSVVACPLTLDYEFFSLALDELSPKTVPRGGTNIGDAIRKVLNDVFDDETERFRDIILITDGEDQQSLPVEAARAGGQMGVRIITIGLGSEQGQVVVVEDGSGQVKPLVFEGQVVKSQLDRKTLEEIASVSAGGVYLHVATGTIDLERVYADLIRSADQTTIEAGEAVRYDEGFGFFIAAALLLLALEVWLNERHDAGRGSAGRRGGAGRADSSQRVA